MNKSKVRIIEVPRRQGKHLTSWKKRTCEVKFGGTTASLLSNLLVPKITFWNFRVNRQVVQARKTVTSVAMDCSCQAFYGNRKSFSRVVMMCAWNFCGSVYARYKYGFVLFFVLAGNRNVYLRYKLAQILFCSLGNWSSQSKKGPRKETSKIGASSRKPESIKL